MLDSKVVFHQAMRHLGVTQPGKDDINDLIDDWCDEFDVDVDEKTLTILKFLVKAEIHWSKNV